MTTPTPAAPVRSATARSLERLEAEIVELATQVTAASARLIALVGEFDAAEGWRQWGMRSTAHWLSWHCGVSVTTGREQVRAARALRGLPLIAAAFGAGRLSYSKVRALTRFATTETEATLVEIAEHATASQIERLRVAACRAATPDDVRDRHARRGLSLRVDDDGSVVGTFRMPPEQAAVFLHGLRAAQGRLGPRPEHDTDASAEAPTDAPARRSAADALVAMAETTLRAGQAAASTASSDRFHLVLHATRESLAVGDDATDDGNGRLELDDGTRLHPATARRLTCDCPTATVTTDTDGHVLHLGRRTRRIRGRLLRAVQIRDRGRCRAPGCTEAAEVIHHIRHWANGGSTCLANLISLCAAHHWQVHEGGCTLVPRRRGEWSMLTPAGTLTPTPPAAPTVPPLLLDPSLRPDAVSGHWDGAALEVNAVLAAIAPTTPRNASAEASGTTGRDASAQAQVATGNGTRTLSIDVMDRYLARMQAMERQAATLPPITTTDD